MSQLLQTDYGDLATLTALRDLWSGPRALTLRLIAAPILPTQKTVRADLTEASFPGYAGAKLITWSEPVIQGSKGLVACDPVLFTREAGAGGDMIYGYWTEPKDDVGKVWWLEVWDNVYDLTSPGAKIELFPTFTNDTEKAPGEQIGRCGVTWLRFRAEGARLLS